MVFLFEYDSNDETHFLYFMVYLFTHFNGGNLISLNYQRFRVIQVNVITNENISAVRIEEVY